MPTEILLIDGQSFLVAEDFDTVWTQWADNEVVSVHLHGSTKGGTLEIPRIFIDSLTVQL